MIDNASNEVAILLTDMVQYSKLTQHMRPEEIRDFIITYHAELQNIFDTGDFKPFSIDPSAGDGAVIVFEKRKGRGSSELCSRALKAAISCNKAIDDGIIPSTRMGLFLGEIIEARLGNRLHKFGSSFAVASRLEELCGYYGTHILMDREMAKRQTDEKQYVVSVGKVTPKNFSSPFNLFTIMKPGLGRYRSLVDEERLREFIVLKNETMDYFCGNLLTGLRPDFPKVRKQLRIAQELHLEILGRRDLATDRILEYIRECPFPDSDFKYTGIKIGDKKGDTLGFRMFHLSKQLMRAIDPDLYNILVANTDWEYYFQLEWCKKGDAIVTVGDPADGIYYIDQGTAHAIDEKGKTVAVFTEGSIFGEMAYYNKEKVRNATVVADSDAVLRKISNEDFEKLPVIKNLFYRLAKKRREEDLPY